MRPHELVQVRVLFERDDRPGAVPRKLPRGADSIRIDYLDPWGGKRCQGELSIARGSLLAPAGKAAPCLEARLPAANIGRREVRRGESTAIVPAAVIGRW